MSAHNPTGCDLEPAHWSQLSHVIKQRNLVAFLDSAYQGFASGDPNKDSQVCLLWVINLNFQGLRILSRAGVDFMLAQSFSKNFGLYGK